MSPEMASFVLFAALAVVVEVAKAFVWAAAFAAVFYTVDHYLPR